MPKKKDTKFTKGHKRGFVTDRSAPLDRRPLQLLLPEGLRDRVMEIDGWRDEIRIMLSQWVEEKEKSQSDSAASKSDQAEDDRP